MGDKKTINVADLIAAAWIVQYGTEEQKKKLKEAFGPEVDK